MFHEKYNYRYVLQQCFSFKPSSKEEEFGYMKYLNLLVACIGKDELSLYNKLLQESNTYFKLKDEIKMLNLAIKTQKYLSRKVEQKFNQEKNVLAFNSNIVRIFYRVAETLKNKECYTTALEWLNKIYTYYENNNIDYTKGRIQKEEEVVRKSKEETKSKIYRYFSKFSDKSKLKFQSETTPNEEKYYIHSNWYNEYQEFLKSKENIEINDKTIPPFPKVIDNLELLSGKEMLENDQYIIDNTKQTLLKEINKDEWDFLKNKFNCTVELPVKQNVSDLNVYKILTLNSEERNNNNYFFRPKYLGLKRNHSLRSYFTDKYGKEFKMYKYTKTLSKKERKELLFDIMFFYSLTQDDNIIVHHDLLEEVQEISSPSSSKIIFVDFDKFININEQHKCFQCSGEETKLHCDKCENNSLINSKFEFCSEHCLSEHNDAYHSKLNNYENFQTNVQSIIKHSINNPKEGGLKGLQNLGNTCFMNAGLQCIFHCKALVNYLIQEQFENEPLNQRDDLSITRAFISLAKKMYNISSNDNDEYNYYSSSRHYSSYSGSLNPSELRAKFVRKEDKYNNFQQHDSPELISDFLDQLSKELNRSKSTYYDARKDSQTTCGALIEFGRKLNNINSIVEDLFYGQSRNQFKCTNPKCNYIKNCYESFLLLDLPFPSKKSVTYYIKFKHFSFGETEPTITEEFEIDDNCMTVGQFKNKHQRNDYQFDVFMLSSKSYEDNIKELADDYVLFEQDEDGNIQLKEIDNDSEIILYEKADANQYYSIFVFPFVATVVKPPELKWLQKLASCVCACNRDTKVDLENIEIMFYPVRMKIDKNDNVLDTLNNLRKDIFKDKLPSLDERLVNSIIYTINKEALKQETTNQNENNNVQPLIQIKETKLNFDDVTKVYLLLSHSKDDVNMLHDNKYISNDEGTIDTVEKSGFDIYDLFKLYHKPKVNKIFCSKCKSKTTMISTISKLPVYLCFHLKRFSYDTTINDFKKLHVYVDFPETLNVYTYVDKEENYSFEHAAKKEECEYELFAVDEHRGGVYGGHYVAYSKVNGTWYIFNDSSVSQDSNYKSSNSLALFYKRKCLL